MVHAADAAFDERPKAFHRVRMSVTYNIDLRGMINALVRVAIRPYIAVTAMLVCEHGGLRHDVFFDERQQRLCAHVLCRFSNHSTAALYRADNGHFADCAAPLNL